MRTQWLLAAIALIAGIYLVLGALLDWKLLTNSFRWTATERGFGRDGTKVVYVLGGVAAIAISILIAVM